MLRRHYWSYLRTPPLPIAHLPDRDDPRRAAERAFSDGYARRIADVQERAARRRAVRLTYRPLGKNLRLLGTAIRRHVDAGDATTIAPEGPRHEIEALSSRGHAWPPWLWSRTGDAALDARVAADAAAAWRELFQPLDGRAAPSAPGRPVDDGPRLAAGVERILKQAAATRYVFHPVAAIERDVAAQKQAMEWPAAGTPVLGLHVRRSDAASSEATGPATSVRRSFPLTAYLDAADRLCAAYGIRHLFIASESAIEIDRARELRPQYQILALGYDRGLFPDIATDRRYIEQLALDRPERARALALTAIMDLRLFCECTAFVGAFNSEFSVLAWLLATGSHGALIPHVSLSRPLDGIAWHPHDALLNVHNNCPLELYHW